jgi:hypothetical protein
LGHVLLFISVLLSLKTKIQNSSFINIFADLFLLPNPN